MIPRDIRLVPVHPLAAYRVSLTLAVEDAGALWDAAAGRAQAHGMSLDDARDTLGPREDPSVADCIAMLAGPVAPAGCVAEEFQVEAIETPALPDVLDTSGRLLRWRTGAAA